MTNNTRTKSGRHFDFTLTRLTSNGHIGRITMVTQFARKGFLGTLDQLLAVGTRRAHLEVSDSRSGL